MTKHIYQKVSVALKISLLSCSLPLLLSSVASSQEQNCSQVQIQANIEKFKDSNKYVSQSAVHAVVKCQPESIKPLIEALNNQSDEVRENAAKALLQIASNQETVPTEAIPRLIQSLHQDNNSSVRMYAAMAIAAMGESAKEAIPQLIQSLQQDKSFVVRTYAAGAFIYMGESGKAAIPQLIQSLKQDSNATVRSATAFVFAYMGESAKEAVPQLIQSRQQDPDSNVRSAAANTLRVLGLATQ